MEIRLGWRLGARAGVKAWVALTVGRSQTRFLCSSSCRSWPTNDRGPKAIWTEGRTLGKGHSRLKTSFLSPTPCR